MNLEKLIEKVEDAIVRIYTDESYLIEKGLSEWTLSAQFYYYMRSACHSLLSGCHFDSEYNLMNNIKDKDLAEKVIFVKDKKKQARPDFIVHQRGSPAHNFLWVELKRKGGRKWINDLRRSKAVTQEKIVESGLDYVTGYTYGVGILFHKKKVVCNWYSKASFIRGRQMNIKYVKKEKKISWADCGEIELTN